ncbi:hypothetical protein ADUPG1_003578, partial [Aduncisulcus paluster]
MIAAHAPVKVDGLAIGTTFVSTPSSGVTQLINESICNDDGYDCAMFNTHGDVIFTAADDDYIRIKHELNQGSNMFIGAENPIIFRFLLDSGLFVEETTMYADGMQAFYQFNSHMFTDEMTATVDGESVTDKYVYGSAPSECLAN